MVRQKGCWLRTSGVACSYRRLSPAEQNPPDVSCIALFDWYIERYADFFNGVDEDTRDLEVVSLLGKGLAIQTSRGIVQVVSLQPSHLGMYRLDTRSKLEVSHPGRKAMSIGREALSSETSQVALAVVDDEMHGFCVDFLDTFGVVDLKLVSPFRQRHDSIDLVSRISTVFVSIRPQ